MVEVTISLAFLHWVRITLHPWPFISDIAIFVLKRDVKLQLTNQAGRLRAISQQRVALLYLCSSTILPVSRHWTPSWARPTFQMPTTPTRWLHRHKPTPFRWRITPVCPQPAEFLLPNDKCYRATKLEYCLCTLLVDCRIDLVHSSLFLLCCAKITEYLDDVLTLFSCSVLALWMWAELGLVQFWMNMAEFCVEGRWFWSPRFTTVKWVSEHVLNVPLST